MAECEACNGTGSYQGAKGGPEWPKCPQCGGRGNDDLPFDPYKASADAIARLTAERDAAQARVKTLEGALMRLMSRVIQGRDMFGIKPPTARELLEILDAALKEHP